MFKTLRSHDQGGKYMVKTLKKFLLRNQNIYYLETWYVASGTKVLPSCSNDDPGLKLNYFTPRLNLVPYALVWEKGETMDISETIVVYDVKVGRYSELIEYMNLYQYQKESLFTDLGQGHSISTFSNSFF